MNCFLFYGSTMDLAYLSLVKAPSFHMSRAKTKGKPKVLNHRLSCLSVKKLVFIGIDAFSSFSLSNMTKKGFPSKICFLYNYVTNSFIYTKNALKPLLKVLNKMICSKQGFH